MRTTLLLPTFLLAVQHLNNSKYLTSTIQSVEDVLQATKPLDVQFVVQDLIGSKSEVIDEIYKSVVRTVPTSCILLNDSVPSNLPSFRAFQGSLVIYVYVSKESPNIQQTQDIIRVIMHGDNRSKILLTTILKEESSNFEALLKEMWKKKRILDVTVLELSEATGVKIHQYNPFTSVYHQQPYNSSVQWFPNKLINLHGYPITVHLANRSGHLFFEQNSEGYPDKVQGPDLEALKTFVRVLNFTLVYNVQTERLNWKIISSGEAEVIFPQLPFFPDSLQYRYTLPVSFEDWCALVAITYRYINYGARAFIGITVSYVIVLVFWATSSFMGFDRNSWHPLKIYGMIISAPVSTRPRRTVERVMFVCIFLVSSIHSSQLYADVTTANLCSTTEVDYKDFEELDRAGVAPVTIGFLVHALFDIGDKTFERLKKKVVFMDNVACGDYLAAHGNVTCLTESNSAYVLVKKHMRDGKATMKFSKNLCIAKPHAVYLFYKLSPYTDRFTSVMLRLQMSGIREKWDYDFARKFSARKTYSMDVGTSRDRSLTTNLVYIGGCGYLISLLVFIVEIMVHRLKKMK
ncbi:uncharacterized protein LOC143375373 [Andrena cerasifolii]|uniref:uncharacterized protein LOC143375373 n=1 Tax=Andrena cerasifolii TaxID=2819439 RepID=UPI00403762E4